jgi:hypothetical protein
MLSFCKTWVFVHAVFFVFGLTPSLLDQGSSEILQLGSWANQTTSPTSNNETPTRPDTSLPYVSTASGNRPTQLESQNSTPGKSTTPIIQTTSIQRTQNAETQTQTTQNWTKSLRHVNVTSDDVINCMNNGGRLELENITSALVTFQNPPHGSPGFTLNASLASYAESKGFTYYYSCHVQCVLPDKTFADFHALRVQGVCEESYVEVQKSRAAGHRYLHLCNSTAIRVRWVDGDDAILPVNEFSIIFYVRSPPKTLSSFTIAISAIPMRPKGKLEVVYTSPSEGWHNIQRDCFL